MNPRFQEAVISGDPVTYRQRQTRPAFEFIVCLKPT
jgi:hypothetical protein